jgi:hypothetical protein
MDPDACWNSLLDLLAAGESWQAEGAAYELGVWIEEGGFVPAGLADAIEAAASYRKKLPG